MGFPYETASWDGVTEAISTGFGTSMPGIFTALGIAACIVALIVGQAAEAKKYRDYK